MKTLLIAAILFAGLTSAQAQNIPANNNRVGLNFMKEVVKSELKDGEKNIMTSPLSLYYALSLAYNGTAGETYDNLSLLLGNPYNDGVTNFNVDMAQYQKNLIILEKAAANEWSPKPPVFGIANSAWQTTGLSPSGGTFNFAQNYVETLKENYSAEVNSLDFKNPASADVINKWAEDKTHGLIKEVVNADMIRDLMWILMNATYIEASWQIPFEIVGEWNAPKFTTVDGAQKDAEMIKAEGYYNYVDNSDVEVIELPFYDTTTSFFVVLPKDIQTFKTLRTGSAWDQNFWNDIFTEMKLSNGSDMGIYIPKFSFDFSVSLKADDELTVATGLNFLFQDEANFSVMAEIGSVPTKVGLIKQDTKVELDENGVKAAAVTTIAGIESTSMPAEPPYTMKVDRPFFYAIADKTTGAIYFLGAVINP